MTLRLTQELLTEISNEADRRGRTRSDFARDCLQLGLNILIKDKPSTD